MQKALDDLVRHYIISETGYEKAEKESTPTSEKDLTSTSSFEHEYIKALYDCLEDKGVVRELQTFLRQKLVAILQDKWPNLNGQDELVSFNPVAVRLVQDFLSSHKLLYTFSVLASETGQMFSLKHPFGKLTLAEAERILDQMDIKEIGSARERILQCYLEKDNFSLLECIISVCPWAWDSGGLQVKHNDRIATDDKRNKQSRKTPKETSLHFRKTLDGKKTNVNEDSIEPIKHTGVEGRLRLLEESVNKDQQSYNLAISRYKDEDAKRIYDEIETRLKFEMLTKEKELLQNYEEKVSSMRKALDREREMWLVQKDREENDIFQHKERIVTLMNSLTEKEQIVKTLLENYQSQNVASEIEIQKRESDYNLKETQLTNTIHKLEEENKLLKKMQRLEKESTVPVSEYHIDVHRPQASSKKQAIEPNNDTIAFLKYSLECQAEEIKQLRSGFANTQSRSPAGQNELPNGYTQSDELYRRKRESFTRNVQEKHLEDFIRGSKQRCDEIEREAKEIERSLESFRDRIAGKSNIRTPIISSTGRLNVFPTLPKYPIPRELPPVVDHSMDFPNLLEQLFPSKDFSIPRPRAQQEEFRPTPPNQNNEAFTRVKEIFENSGQFNDKLRNCVDPDILSKFQESMADIRNLVTTANSISQPSSLRKTLNAILENEETPLENLNPKAKPPFKKAASLADMRLPRNPISHLPDALQLGENRQEDHAGGDARLFSSPQKNTTSRGYEVLSQPSTPENNSNNLEVKASESGALIKEKVASPTENDYNADKSEASISIRSIMKTKINSNNNNARVQPISERIMSLHDDTNYITEEDDISISAPDMSQSPADDFWNV